jgi:hypothetical protein
MEAYKLRQNEIALRCGLDLPRIAKLRLEPPAFAVGPCNAMRFSPDGRWLVVPTNNGTWLWDVATGTKGPKLAVPSNPSEFAFSADGSVLLVRNETSQFVRLALPSGEPLARFRARYELRMDGGCALGPDNRTVLQFAYEGMLLVMDGDTGRVLLQRQLERTGYSAEIWWNAAAGEVILSQTSVAGRDEQGWPCALWRWRWPLEQHEPERVPGKWSGLRTQWLARHGRLLMHHQPDPKRRHESALDVVDGSTFALVRRIDCGGNLRPAPTMSHDLGAWAVLGNEVVEVGAETGRWSVPSFVDAPAFSPTQDLFAISGKLGVVAPLAQWPALLETYQSQYDDHALRQRAYARLSFYPDRTLPPRLVAYSGPAGWLFECEAPVSASWYAPQDEAIGVAAEASPADRMAAFARAIDRVRTAATAPGSIREMRRYNAGVVTPPPGDWTRAVAVSLAADAIDLWPLKPKGAAGFELDQYPAALPPTSEVAAIWSGIERMSGYFKPRRTA